MIGWRPVLGLWFLLAHHGCGDARKQDQRVSLTTTETPLSYSIPSSTVSGKNDIKKYVNVSGNTPGATLQTSTMIPETVTEISTSSTSDSTSSTHPSTQTQTLPSRSYTRAYRPRKRKNPTTDAAGPRTRIGRIRAKNGVN
jgi:hypothetical protein